MLQKAYELLDRRLDEKIREKNLKIPTIAAAKESINIVCQEKISSIAVIPQPISELKQCDPVIVYKC
ncbi:hypothetical protein ACSN2X_004587 [Vibrio parahaemolyticus]